MDWPPAATLLRIIKLGAHLWHLELSSHGRHARPFYFVIFAPLSATTRRFRSFLIPTLLTQRIKCQFSTINLFSSPHPQKDTFNRRWSNTWVTDGKKSTIHVQEMSQERDNEGWVLIYNYLRDIQILGMKILNFVSRILSRGVLLTEYRVDCWIRIVCGQCFPVIAPGFLFQVQV